jgi:hypothetical protein
MKLNKHEFMNANFSIFPSFGPWKMVAVGLQDAPGSRPGPWTELFGMLMLGAPGAEARAKHVCIIRIKCISNAQYIIY